MRWQWRVRIHELVAGLAIAILFGLSIGIAFERSCPAPSKQKAEGTKPTHSAANAVQSTDPPSPRTRLDVKAAELHAGESSADAPQNQDCAFYNTIANWLFDIKLSDIFLVFFTAVLAYKTAGLDRATRGLQRAAIRQDRNTRESLAIARRQANSDRPHMLVSEFKVSGLREPAGEDGRVRTKFEFRFINYGRSPAFVGRVCFCRHIGTDLPSMPDYGSHQQTDRIIAVNGWYGSREPSVQFISAAETSAVLEGQEKFFIFGFLEYGDVSGQTYTNKFAYEFFWDEGDVSKGFAPAGPESYRAYS